MNIVAVYCFSPPPGYSEPGVYYFPVFGHCFGFVSSINNFSTMPALLCTIGRCTLAAPVEAYVDDFNNCDLRLPNCGPNCGAQRAMVELLRLFGWPIEAPKSQEAGVVNKFLGMMGDTSLASTLNRAETDPLEVSFYPNEDRVGNILGLMDQCDPAEGGSGIMTPHQAEVLLGKLGFLLRGAHGSVGRGASQPIFSRKHDLTGQLAWNEALAHSFAFFRKLFTRFPVLTWRLDADETPWLLVYTDACKNTRFGGLGVVILLTWRLDADETPWLLVYTDACKNTRFGGLGVVIFDRATGRRYVSSAMCPKDIEESFARGGYIINQLELLAILTALLTFPELFRNRRALWFVDNCSALSACVHGYANKLDMAKMANSVRLALCSLGVRARFDWVPTDANISDTPSRVSRKADMSKAEEAAWNLLELPNEDGWTPMVFPSASALRTYDACAQLVPHRQTRTYIRAQGYSEKPPPGAAHA